MVLLDARLLARDHDVFIVAVRCAPRPVEAARHHHAVVNHAELVVHVTLLIRVIVHLHRNTRVVVQPLGVRAQTLRLLQNIKIIAFPITKYKQKSLQKANLRVIRDDPHFDSVPLLVGQAVPDAVVPLQVDTEIENVKSRNNTEYHILMMQKMAKYGMWMVQSVLYCIETIVWNA